jgi:hypothetical protein
MKKALFLLLWGFMSLITFGQEMPPARLIDKDYRQDYRQNLREEEQVMKDLQRQKWDIIIDLPARVPTEVSIGPSVIDHWAKKILLPDALVARLIAECKEPVVVKISDTGVDQTHPELKGNGSLWLPASDYTGDGPELHLHGTHVAGITYSLIEPLINAGIVQMKSCRNLGTEGQGNFSWAANMLATERPQDVEFEKQGKHVLYNFSWGGMTGIQSGMEKELETSSKLGVIFIAAAGNNGAEVPSYPASSAYVIATASLDENLQVSSYSTRGIFVDNAAPGRNIKSTVPGGGFATLSGTSMASPMLFSAAIIAKSKYGDRIPDVQAMHKYLAAIASDIQPAGWDKETGWGLVYFTKILDTRPEDVIGNPPPPPPAPDLNTITSSWNDGYFMRWQYNGEKVWKQLFITEVRLTVSGAGIGEEVFDKFSAWLPTYFKNRALVMSKDRSGPEAAWWAGKFIEIIAKDQGFTVQALELTAFDESGRKFICNDFGGTPKVSRLPEEDIKLILFKPAEK